MMVRFPRCPGKEPFRGRLLVGTTLFLALLLGACESCSKDPVAIPPNSSGPARGFVTLQMGGQEVHLELAITEAARQRGLMGRKKLDTNQGMLFIYTAPKPMRFWMKDTRIPLSIAFLKDDGTITNIEEMRPNVQSPAYLSKGWCRYAVEMSQGWFAKHGIQAGDRITLTPEILALKPE